MRRCRSCAARAKTGGTAYDPARCRNAYYFGWFSAPFEKVIYVRVGYLPAGAYVGVVAHRMRPACRSPTSSHTSPLELA